MKIEWRAFIAVILFLSLCVWATPALSMTLEEFQTGQGEIRRAAPERTGGGLNSSGPGSL